MDEYQKIIPTWGQDPARSPIAMIVRHAFAYRISSTGQRWSHAFKVCGSERTRRKGGKKHQKERCCYKKLW